MKNKLKLLRPTFLKFMFTLSFLVGSLEIKSQDIYPSYLSIADGLVSPSVNDVMQDSYGLLWIATVNGLQKYDGYRFETFKNSPGKSTSLQSNEVWDVVEDEDQNLWVATALGVSKYNRKTNEFTNYLFSTIFNMAVNGGRVFRLFIDSQNDLWAAAQNLELLHYDRTSDQWIRAPYLISGNTITDHIGFSIAIAEDSKGSLWLGSTIYGLMQRPKGELAFKPIDSSQIGGFDFTTIDNRITSIFADATHTLWITTRNGVYKFNPENGSFKIIKEYTEFQEARIDINNHFNRILQDPEGNVWISNNFRGILKFDGISDQFKELAIAGKLIMRGLGWSTTLSDFTIDRSGIFWFGTRESGLMKYDPVNKPFSALVHDPANPNSLSPNGVYGILASKVNPDVIYVGTRGAGVTIYDTKKQTFNKVTYKVVDDRFGGSVRSIAENSDGSLWLGTWGDGMIQLDKNFSEVRRFKNEPGNAGSISYNQVRLIKPDDQGRLWIGTDNGLNIFSPETGNFQRITSMETRVYPDQLIKEIEQLATTTNSIGKIDQVTDDQKRSIPIEIKATGRYYIMSVGEGDLGSNADFGWIANSAKDTIWKFPPFEDSYYAGGALKNRMVIAPIALEQGTYTLYYKTDDSHSYGLWNTPKPDKTSFYGIVLVRPADKNQENTIETQLKQINDEIIISGSSISDIEIGEKYVWVGTRGNGLNRFDPMGNSVTYYTHHPDSLNSLSNNTISDILLDSKGMIWLATDDGINILNPITEEIKTYSEGDGLPTNLILSIEEGNAGEMWIATQSGLSQMVTNETLGKVTFINYNATDGLGGDSFVPLTSTKSADGHFYFGGDHGLTTFKSITANNVPPALIITNLLISNKSVLEMGAESPLENSLLNTNEITLSHDQNNLSFEFAALHFASPEKNQYAHKLVGYDKDWIYDNRNFAAYTNLDPGTYEFVIRAANAYGIWNEEGKSIKISILPPWWQTWWAYLLYTIFAGLIIFVVDRTLRRRIKLKERERSREKELAHALEIKKAYTELKATQSQLIQSEKMASLGELTAGIAHEIQNPLNFVNNFSEVSIELADELMQGLSKVNLESKQKKELQELADDLVKNQQKIHHHGKRADAIVKGMLQHSRASSGQKEVTDINALADEYLRLAYHGLRARDKSFNANLETQFEPNLQKIDVVPQDLGRVLLNLITNAFYAVTERAKKEYASYKPTVAVQTETEGDTILIHVRDNGGGIPEAIKEKIFQPFFTTKPAGKGTGLGLSLSYDIIKAHGGEIRVDSKPGEGTEFSIVLPG